MQELDAKRAGDRGHLVMFSALLGPLNCISLVCVFRACVFLACVPLLPGIAIGDVHSQLRIADCNGSIRYSGEVSSAEKVGVSIQVNNTGSNEASVTISSPRLIRVSSTDNSARNISGEVLGETVSFTDVTGGDWKVCSSSGDFITFRNVQVLGSEQMAKLGGSTPGIIGVTAATAGVAVSALAISGDAFSSSNSDSRGGTGSAGISASSDANDDTASITAPVADDAFSFDDEDYEFGDAAEPLSPIGNE